MSWFLGIINYKKKNFERLDHIHCKNNVLYSAKHSNIVYEAGGIISTCKCLKHKDLTLIVLGSPVNNSSLELISDEELFVMLKSGDYKNLSGAFTIIEISNNNIRIFCDKLNLRKFYYYSDSDSLILSTDLHWISTLTGSIIDYEALGVYWYLNHSYRNNSLFNNIKVVSGIMSYSLVKKSLSTENHYYTPLTDKYDKNINIAEIIEPLGKLIRNLSKYNLSLGLSGGVDSRTILAILLHYNINFTTHTFGDSLNPDVDIAKKLAYKFRFKNETYNNHIEQNVNNIVNLVKNYTKRNEMSFPITSIPIIDHLSKLNAKNLFMIDGGFICFMRRYSYNKLSKNLKNSIKSGHVDAYFSVLKTNNQNYFNTDIQNVFQQSCQKHLTEVIDSINLTKDFHYGDILDSVRFRYHNSYMYAPSQKLYDECIPNIMIGAQRVLTDLFFSIDPKVRHKALLNKQIMKLVSPKLRNYPIARYDTKIYWSSNRYLDYAQGYISNKLSLGYQSGDSEVMLMLLKEWLYDNLNSTKIKNSDFLDIASIKDLADNYHNNKIVSSSSSLLKAIQLIMFFYD